MVLINMSRIRRLTFWLLLVAQLLFIGGCDRGFPALPGNKTPVRLELPAPPDDSSTAVSEETRWGLLYYPDLENRFLVPVHRPIPFSETIIRDTLNCLLPSPEEAGALASRGFQFILPQGSTILGISLNEGLARVDFNSSILNYDPEDERLVLGSLLCTLHQFPEIERLQILVDGAEMERFPGGTSGLAPLGPGCWINLEIEEGVEDYRQYSAVKVYFCYYHSNNETWYVPVTRILAPNEKLAEAAFRELLAGPRPGSGLFSEIPPGTTLGELTQQETLLTINLSKQLLTYRGGITGAENIVHQLLLTAAGLPGVEQVQVLVEGQPAYVPGELDLSNPLPLPGPVNCF